MSIDNASVPFTESLISQAPEATGVFALWRPAAAAHRLKLSR
jgi:hypothetical protein